MADPDFAADEETIQAALGVLCDDQPSLLVADLAAIARKYQRALMVLSQALAQHGESRALAEVRRILEGGE